MKKKLTFYSAYITCILTILWFLSCAINPVTGERELMLLTEKDEIKMGKETDKQIIVMYGIYSDGQLTQYINSMGQRMAGICHRPHLKFEFKVMDNSIINAFAVPGGYVYFTRGILAYLNSEAELAGVMGHEIGHVAARHSAKQYSKAQLAGLGIGLGSIFSEQFAQYSGLVQQGIGLLFLKFSRDNEREADKLGVEYSTKIGYDSKEMANFFVTLDKMSSKGKGSLPNWLSTHPNPENRIEAIRSESQRLQRLSTKKKWEINRDNYLRKINGIIYGEDPRQGFVENNIFYHPLLRFQFNVPQGWNINNLPSQVQIISPNELAVILFSQVKNSRNETASSKFINDNQASVTSKGTSVINGLKALILQSKITKESNSIEVLSYFIEKNSDVFIFHGISSIENYSKYKNHFRDTMNGFQELKDKSKLNIQPDRISIKMVNEPMRLEQALRKFGVDNKKLNELALINGKELNEIIPANTLIKIIEKGR
jgi:predicted Zn-dependent protease